VARINVTSGRLAAAQAWRDLRIGLEQPQLVHAIGTLITDTPLPKIEHTSLNAVSVYLAKMLPSRDFPEQCQ